MDWNGISNPNRLQIGQELRLHGNAQQAEAAPPPTGTYTVEPGDSLYSIARAHELTVDQLKAFNSLSSNTIQPGQVLKLGAE